jgi:alkaline phosphatase
MYVKSHSAKRQLLALVVLLTVVSLVAGCASIQPTPVAEPPATGTEEKPTGEAKYVFLFIGDGMGVAQRNAAEVYLSNITDSKRPEDVRLVMNSLPAQGMNTTYDLTSVIPDSASTATAISTGYKTSSGTICMDPDHTRKYTTIAEVAKSKGWKVGIISSVSIDHATPAAFYAHQPSRNNYYEISMELANSNFDYFGGGAPRYPAGKNKDQPSAIEAAKANGYTVVNTKADFGRLNANSGKVWAITPYPRDSDALYYDIDRPADDISLAEYVKKGIELLDNPNGFFLMCEGGKIDWACHANDAASAIWDTLAFDAAVLEAKRFYDQHPDETLIVVTGDHECGGMTIGFAGTQYSTFFDKLRFQRMSYVEFDAKLAAYKKTHSAETAKFVEIRPLIEQAFGLVILSPEETADLEAKAEAGDQAARDRLGLALSQLEVDTLVEAFEQSMLDKELRASNDYTYLLYGGYEPLTVSCTHILNQKAGISWTSFSHTGVPVQTSAIGPGSEALAGYYDQPDIYRAMAAATGLAM